MSCLDTYTYAHTFEHLYVTLLCRPKIVSEHQFACYGIQNSGGDTTTIIPALIPGVHYPTEHLLSIPYSNVSHRWSLPNHPSNGRKYPSWRCTHFHGPMAPLSTSAILRASRNFKLGTSESKGLARPETELPGDLLRSWQCREGSTPYSKVHATGLVLQEGLWAEKNTILTCCFHCCGPQYEPFGVVITPGLGLRPRCRWLRGFGRIRHWD